MVQIDQLKKINFFEGFSPAQLQQIATHCIEKEYSAGEVICQENEPATHLYFLSKGLMDVVIQLPRGNPVTALTIYPGELFGWSALVAPYLFTSSAVTKEPSMVITLEAAILKGLFSTDTELGYEIMARIAATASQRLRETRQQLLLYIYQESS